MFHVLEKRGFCESSHYIQYVVTRIIATYNEKVGLRTDKDKNKPAIALVIGSRLED